MLADLKFHLTNWWNRVFSKGIDNAQKIEYTDTMQSTIKPEEPVIDLLLIGNMENSVLKAALEIYIHNLTKTIEYKIENPKYHSMSLEEIKQFKTTAVDIYQRLRRKLDD